MSEIPKNIPLPDMSEILSTYKSHPTAEDNAAPKGLIIKEEKKEIASNNKSETPWKMPKCDTPFEKKMYILHEGTRMFQMMIDGIVKLAKVGAWCIAIFGSLFVALLATNTMDRATEILNTNLLSKWGKSINVTQKTSTEKTLPVTSTTTGAATPGLKSSALNAPPTTSETPEIIAKKRAALLEARKNARLQQEKIKAAEKTLTK